MHVPISVVHTFMCPCDPLLRFVYRFSAL